MNPPRRTQRIVRWNETSERERAALLGRPALQPDRQRTAVVRAILDQVRNGGDTALTDLAEQHDKVRLTEFRVADEDFAAAEQQLSRAAITAIDVAIANVRRFHEAQRSADICVDTMPGVRCERVSRPLDAVGLYVPAGSAPLPSAAVMLAVPAAIAGCRRRIVCTPPRRDGSADPAVLVAARRGGIGEVYRVGGAQAIAAMAYGTAQIGAVDKIFGPGNAWVTMAKTLVSNEAGGPAIDMPAGPSEVMVIADAGANADFMAADLLSQAEHGPDSQVVLLTTCETLAGRTLASLDRQRATLPRGDIAAEALAHSRIIVDADIGTLVSICNAYAPEHLIVHAANPRALLPGIRNAGSVFLGAWTPESAGDYCSGTNHVLPTGGAARCYSGLGVDQFLRQMTVQELTRDGLAALAPTIAELAALEGLDAHAAAVTVRLATRAGGQP